MSKKSLFYSNTFYILPIFYYYCRLIVISVPSLVIVTVAVLVTTSTANMIVETPTIGNTSTSTVHVIIIWNYIHRYLSSITKSNNNYCNQYQFWCTYSNIYLSYCDSNNIVLEAATKTEEASTTGASR